MHYVWYHSYSRYNFPNYEPQWVDSSGKGFGLGGISIRSKGSNSLGETISKSQSAGEAEVLRNLCGGSAFHKSDVYLIGVGTRSALPCMGSSSSKKVFELRVLIEFHLFNMNMCYDVLQVTLILQMTKLLMRKMRTWIEKQVVFSNTPFRISFICLH
jgi:hypothetical protein